MEICNLMDRLWRYDLILVGTLNAYNQSGQTTLVREILMTGIPAAVIAMRLPYDLTAFPEAKTYLCTYSILEPSMDALAAGLFGDTEFSGHLPVSIPGLYALGHGLTK